MPRREPARDGGVVGAPCEEGREDVNVDDTRGGRDGASALKVKVLRVSIANDNMYKTEVLTLNARAGDQKEGDWDLPGSLELAIRKG